MIFEYLREITRFYEWVNAKHVQEITPSLILHPFKMSTRTTLAHGLTNPFKLYNKIGALFSYVNYDEEEV